MRDLVLRQVGMKPNPRWPTKESNPYTLLPRRELSENITSLSESKGVRLLEIGETPACQPDTAQ